MDKLPLATLLECAGERHIVEVGAFEFPLLIFVGEAAELFCGLSRFGASDVSPCIFKCPCRTRVEVLDRAPEE